ncbi:MAG: MaoC/PaaZ C-terminal domain-containing protein [Pseudomonadota bacterium]
MPFNHEALTAHLFAPTRQSYTTRDTMLYALGLGLGADPLDPLQLRYVYEQDLVTLPTMAVVLGHPGFWASDPALGIDWGNMLQVGQGLTVYRPISSEGEIMTRSRVADVIDRGEGRGALLYYERDVLEAQTEDLIATVRQTLLCRSNGGFGGEPRKAPAARGAPERAPDHVVDTPTLPQAALIYRLSGDVNPMHVDPAVAARAGFTQPILHGLATFGIAAVALIQNALDGDATRLTSLDTRFTSPVFPGDTIRTELWVEGDQVLLRASVPARGVVALDAGVATIEPLAVPQAVAAAL